jgi:prepilin signal peptidase PulO-like enzyme (type II secretory pathway)
MALIYWLPISIVLAYGINLLADILPEDKILLPPACLHCKQRLTWASYLSYGKCRACGQKATLRHWLVLVFCPLAALFVEFFPPPRSLHFYYPALFLILVFYFLLVLLIDVEHRLILYSVSLVGIVLAVPVGLYLHGWLSTLIGCAIGTGIMLLLFLLGYVFTLVISKLRKQKVEEMALGFGDVILTAIIGALLGFPGIFLSLLIAIVLGGLVSLIYMLIMKMKGRYELFTAIPYGPFLIVSAIALLYLVQ